MASNSAVERRNYVLQRLNEEGHVAVGDLAERFDVSAVTIRKDLGYLEGRNMLVRTHGGAIANNHFAYDLPFEEKAKRHEQEKKRIGARAAEMVDERDIIILDAGTTTLNIFRSLRATQHLKIATNSVLIAIEALRRPGLDLILLGGALRASSASVVGPYAEEMLRDHSFRKLFLAGDGFDIAYGLTTTDDYEASLNRLMIAAAEKTIVTVDSSKFGRRGLCRICGLEAIDAVVTDEGAPPAAVDGLEEQGVEVIIA